jgi:hypothetical protein
MVAYRAETAMANVLREVISRPDEARTLLRALYSTDADLIPDHSQQTLTIALHHLANPCSNAAIQKLCDELNETETVFPRSNLQLVFKLGSAQNPRDQVVRTWANLCLAAGNGARGARGKFAGMSGKFPKAMTDRIRLVMPQRARHSGPIRAASCGGQFARRQ